MAKIKVKLRELMNADVRYISLVDRAASRIPFRVLKRDEENDMGIDLARIFKGEKTKPEVAAVVVFAQQDADVAEQVRQSIADAGFVTDRVQKADDGETTVYAQGDNAADAVLVRLSDQTVVAIKHLPVGSGPMAEKIAEVGFYPGVTGAFVAAHEMVQDRVAKGESIADVMESFSAYVGSLSLLPTAVFKMDAAINEVIQKAAKPEEKPKEEAATEEKPEEEAEEMEEGACEKCGQKMQVKKGTKGHCEKCSTKKEDEPVEAPKVEEPKTEEPKTEETVQKTEEPVPPAEPVWKSDLQAVLDAIKGVSEQVQGLATKVDAVEAAGAETKKVLDDTVKKAENLESKVNATVVAAAPPPDAPAETQVKKAEQTFEPVIDTAFQRRKR